MSPEVAQGEAYGKACDLWGCGVILFTLISGSLPFNGPKHRIIESIIAGRYNMRTASWEGVSSEAADLCTSLLNTDHASRMTVEEALEHPWIKVSSGPLIKKSKKDCAYPNHEGYTVQQPFEPIL